VSKFYHTELNQLIYDQFTCLLLLSPLPIASLVIWSSITGAKEFALTELLQTLEHCCPEMNVLVVDTQIRPKWAHVSFGSI
jgi:hypothetical protein